MEGRVVFHFRRAMTRVQGSNCAGGRNVGKRDGSARYARPLRVTTSDFGEYEQLGVFTGKVVKDRKSSLPNDSNTCTVLMPWWMLMNGGVSMLSTHFRKIRLFTMTYMTYDKPMIC